MSGGSMDYLYLKVLNAAETVTNEDEDGFVKNTELRKAFAEHLFDVALALKQIEWVDSGDSAEGSEDEAIKKCLNIP